MVWRSYLTDEELEKLSQIEADRIRLTAEYRAIYDLCRKRRRAALDAIEITTPSGHVFIIDHEDMALISPYRWFAVCHVLKNGKARTPYIQGKVDGRRIYLHRFLMGNPEGKVIDHIDGDPLNNCRANLRIVSHSENMRGFKLPTEISG